MKSTRLAAVSVMPTWLGLGLGLGLGFGLGLGLGFGFGFGLGLGLGLGFDSQRDAHPRRVDRADEEAHLLLLLEATTDLPYISLYLPISPLYLPYISLLP